MYCCVTTNSKCITLLLLAQHIWPCYYWLNIQYFVSTIFTVFRLLTDFVCLYNYEFWLSLCKIVGVRKFCYCPYLWLLTQHVLLCYYHLSIYYCVATNSTCNTLLLLTQHVLLCHYYLNIYYFVTTNSTCFALLLLTHYALLCYY
jgi:hypothetical protein